MTYVYHLFPNVMLATFPDQVLVVVIDPVDIDHSTRDDLRHDHRRGGRALSSTRHPCAGARSLLAAGALEATKCRKECSADLHAGANTFVEFGTHESAIGRFHATLDERLELSR